MLGANPTATARIGAAAFEGGWRSGSERSQEMRTKGKRRSHAGSLGVAEVPRRQHRDIRHQDNRRSANIESVPRAREQFTCPVLPRFPILIRPDNELPNRHPL